jgi:1,4-alpha-glucan branching enzyme
LRRFVGDLNQMYRAQSALYSSDFDPRGFCWIDPNDWQSSVYSFTRSSIHSDELLVVACNFTPVPRENYRLGVPRPGFYKELVNSDAEIYGGGNMGNGGGMYSEPIPSHGRDQSINITLPPLAVVIFKPLGH